MLPLAPVDQDAIVAAMREPGFYPVPPQAVELITTHISHVFLAGAFVYKLKRAVTLPFLDFSTLDQRRRACEEELRLNRRLAPEMYVGVVPISRGANGRPQLGGARDPIDYVVWMRRLPDESLLDARLRSDTVPSGCIERLAERLAVFHAGCDGGPSVTAQGDPDVLLESWNATLRSAERFIGASITESEHRVLAAFGSRFVAQHGDLLRRRQHDGRIREGHGDLKAEHVCILEHPIAGAGRLAPFGPGILIFDCLEFSRTLRSADVASEIAFLCIDLEATGHSELADELTRTYAALTCDETFTAVLPFYKAYRAMVRGVVDAFKQMGGGGEEAGARAAAWFRRAVGYAWRAQGPCIIACSGRSGTGKSAVATRLAELTGSVLVSSDIIRKTRAGTAMEAALPQEAYAPAARAGVYDAMEEALRAALADGRGVIVDATFLSRADRDRVMRIARQTALPLLFVVCRASDPVVKRRLAARPPGPSDATWEVYVQQGRSAECLAADEPHVILETDGELASIEADALQTVWRWRTQADPVPRVAHRQPGHLPD